MAEREKNRKSSQVEKFIQAARELRCNESEAAFKKTLKRIGKTPPQPKEKSKKEKPGQ